MAGGCFPAGPGSQRRCFLQLEQMSSLQSLLTHIATARLPASLGGGLPYCHQAWLHFRMVSALRGAWRGGAGILAGRAGDFEGIQIQAGR